MPATMTASSTHTGHHPSPVLMPTKAAETLAPRVAKKPPVVWAADAAAVLAAAALPNAAHDMDRRWAAEGQPAGEEAGAAGTQEDKGARWQGGGGADEHAPLAALLLACCR